MPDWNDPKLRELLWRAYPEGFLPMRGVLSVGGWTVVEPNEEEEPCFLAPWKDEGPYCEMREWSLSTDVKWSHLTHEVLPAGDLLPNVQPDDSATWACCLQDLAPLVNMDKHTALSWAPLRDEGGHIGWQLVGWTDRACRWECACFSYVSAVRDEDVIFSHVYPYGTGSLKDPAIALVTARAQLREEAP